MKCPWCEKGELNDERYCRRCHFRLDPDAKPALDITEAGAKALQREAREAAGEAGLSDDEMEEAVHG